MAHEIYTTKGFIIASENKGESDRILFLFTESFGLIRASAQGSRKLESKLRYALQDFTFGEFSFVRGKHGWRLTSAHALAPSYAVTDYPIKIKTLRLLKKLSGEDEANELLFSELLAAFSFIDAEGITGEDKSVEALLVLKILSSLGYWGEEKGDTFVQSPFTKASVDSITAKRKIIIQELNKSLRATQLL